MEEVLEQLIRETSSNKHSQIRQACVEAKDLLESQAALLRSPPHELRAICFKALQLSLETRQSKLVSLSVSGYAKLLRDNQFHSGYEEDDETTWLPCQLLAAIQSLPLHSEDVQVELLKVLLTMSCINGMMLSGQIVTQVVGVCGLAYGRGGTALRTAAQSAASQAIAHLVKQLNEESQEQDKLMEDKERPPQSDEESEQSENEESEYIAPAYDEIVPVINLISDKLTEANKHPEEKKAPEVPVLFLLECMNTLLTSLARLELTPPSPLPQKVASPAGLAAPSAQTPTFFSPPAYCSSLLVGVLWQRLCPALIALLGSPVSQRLSRPTGRAEGQMGRGSGCIAHPRPLFNNQQARAIYNIACKLVVTMGGVGEMRPVLESLFHRMLLYPPPQCRLDALKAVKELLSNPLHLVHLAGPILYTDSRNPHQNDLALFRLVMDSLTECGNCSDTAIQRAVVDCVSCLLMSLEKVSLGSPLSSQYISAINSLYARLGDGDYSGPLTYENKSKLPKYETGDNLKGASESAGSDTLSERLDDLGLEADDISSRGEKEGGSEDEEIDEEAKGEEEENEGDDEEKPQELGGRKGHDSDASGDTEGPEDDDEDPDREQMENFEVEAEQQREEQEALRLHRLNESLQSTSNLRHVVDEEAERECINARHFTTTLSALLPSLLAIRSTIEVDQALLEFSSKYCEGVFCASHQDEGHHLIINADGIYITAYSLLSFNLQLIKGGHYCDPNLPYPYTQDQFVDMVHGSGVLVYLSSAWLGEVYRQVVKDSLLQRAGYSPHSPHNCALINLLTDLDYGTRCYHSHDSDLDGLGSTEQKSQLLSDHRRLEKAASNVTQPPDVLAGLKLSRRVVTCCWESVIGVLGAVLGGVGGTGSLTAPLRLLISGEGVREESRKAQELLSQCLNALQSAARLANVLGLQNRCGVVFSLLSSACLPHDERNPINTPRRSRLRSPSVSKKPQRLHTSHLLSVHVMMSSGLELGSHASDCWTHIFRCCVYLAELEHSFFSSNSAYHSFPTRFPPPSLNKDKTESGSPCELFGFEDQYRFVAPVSPLPGSVSVEELIRESQSDISSSGFLSPADTGKAICALTQLVDRLFDDAATKLNMSALISFLTELCAASQAQLFSRMVPQTPQRVLIKWPKKKGAGGSGSDLLRGKGGDILLLHRLAEVMLRAVRSGRPLIHIMRAWAVAGPHFMEAACHKDGAVSKKAVSSIHDVVNALLSNSTELSHFHFNEALFKPFENLLCLELCDADVQDQIISSICEFVESCTPEIRSGWRPLFAALRCVRPPSVSPPGAIPGSAPGISGGTPRDSVGHLHVVRDVFEAFLATDNVLVFANAALDCILCLLKHVKGSGEETTDETVVGWDELVSGDLCLDALRYLHRCAAILASMYEMPACPVFHAAHRIFQNTAPQLVDPHLPNIDEAFLRSLVDEVTGLEVKKVSYGPLWPSLNGKDSINLIAMDGSSGILQVWYLLLEGLAGATMTCPRRYQPQTLDTLFSLLRSLPDCPGPLFGMYCVNHLLLPLMQGWLRRSYTVTSATTWDFTASFKQYTGLTSDLVVEYITKQANKGVLAESSSALLMLQQCLLVLIECISHPSETISRLGCACIRHVINSCGEHLPPRFWDAVVCGLHRSCQVALYPLYQLMNLFHPDSPNFYGDVGQVKVAARRDCTGKDSDRLRQLSHQVFLLDTQRSGISSTVDNPDAEDRSFIFLLYLEDQGLVKASRYCDLPEEGEPVRVPFRTLVVGLLAHQILLQTLGTLLVQGSPHIIPSLANVLLQGVNFSNQDSEDGHIGESEGKVPGFLSYMTPEQIQILLDALQLSYTASVEFDRRPGLKFLIQKVAQAERAANLYKQAGASWTLRMVTLFDLTLSQVKHGLGLDEVKGVLEKEVRAKNTLKEDTKGDAPNETLDNEVASSVSLEKAKRPTQLLKDDTMQYINLLKDSFTELCNVYLDLVIDRDGHYSAVDRINDQPIFFLTVQADEFPTGHRKSLEQWTKSLEEFNEEYMKGRRKDSESERDEKESFSGTMTVGGGHAANVDPSEIAKRMEGSSDARPPKEDIPYESRPFTLADLAQEYSSDSEDSEIIEYAEGGDSGVASLAGGQQSVYRVVTEREIANLMTDYRRRKNQHSLPSMHREKRSNPFLEKKASRPIEPVPPEIEEQRTSSLMKDSEAHLKVWTEMVVTVFDLISQLSDSELRPLLPLLFSTMRSLTAHAHDSHLRQVVAELLTRVATLYGFSPAE